MKKHIALLLCLNLFFSLYPAGAISLRSQKTKLSKKLENKPELSEQKSAGSLKETVLKARVQKLISKGKKISIRPLEILNSEINLEGDFFSASLRDSDALQLGLPSDSKLIGEIIKVKNAKSFNRRGKIEVHISEIALPDGQRLKADAHFVSSKKKSTAKTLKKIAKAGSALSFATIVGAKDAFQYGGLHAAVATHGISIAAGAALGLGMGLLGNIAKQGEIQASSGFGTVDFKLKDNFVIFDELPLISQKLEPIDPGSFGIGFSLKDVKKEFSSSFGEFLVLDLDLKNNSPRNLFLGDIVLNSEDHNSSLLSNPLISNTALLETLSKNESTSLKLSFSLDKFKKKSDYKLQLIDPISQEAIVDFNLDFSKLI